MSFLSTLFKKKEKPNQNYAEFWNWFQQNEKQFFSVVKNKKITHFLFNNLSSQLEAVKDGITFLMGMLNENTAELIISADGKVMNFVFVEELVAAAPIIDGWQFRAFKPDRRIETVSIKMGKYVFDKESLFFFSNDDKKYPDSIDISIVYTRFVEEDATIIENGVFAFVENFIGELNILTTIDKISVLGSHETRKKLIPIEKLKDYIVWRQKEFVEKYKIRRFTNVNENYITWEAKMPNGLPVVAIVNSTILKWNAKASHPWVVIVEIKYKSNKARNGMPDPETSELLNEIEDKIVDQLKVEDGYLYVGRQTANSVREIYFACKDFRKPSKVIYQLKNNYSKIIPIDCIIAKDKYWQEFERFMRT